MVTYQTLNDAASLEPELAVGNTQIWYFKNEYARAALFGDFDQIPINPADLSATHVLLGSIDGRDMEDIFYVLQGDVWSPNGEARDLISKLGLGHTSMSMGDIIVVDGVAYICATFGWKKLD